MKEFDVIIAGGGIVGATTALALSKITHQRKYLNIALVEAVEVDSNASPSFDERAVALSASSVAIYKSLNLWAELEALAEPISDIHISEQNHFGFTRLSAKDHHVNVLGQVIPLSETGPILWRSIQAQENITSFCPNVITSVDSLDDQLKNEKIIVELKQSKDPENNSKQIISAKLLIASDGTFSNLAKMAKIKTERASYNQQAIIANISTQKPHQNKAYERFTKEGPIALLPLSRNRMSLVWCQNEAQSEATLKLSDVDFILSLQKSFGFRLGKITRVGERSSYPLSLHLPQKNHNGRTLLLGNSAHTLHPIAGQGFNLGLRDIAALVDAVRESLKLDKKTDIGTDIFLEEYQVQREPDWQQTIGATDSLVRLFSNEFVGLNSARSKGLWLIDKVPFIKNKIANAAMGFNGESAKLTRGLN